MKKLFYIPILISLVASFFTIQAMEEDPNSLNVQGLPLTDVLIVLYNNATGTGEKITANAYLVTIQERLTREAAQKLVGTSIDYLQGRKMALCPLENDFSLSCTAYNNNHGPGRAQGAVAKLRELLRSKSNLTEDDLRRHCYYSVWEKVIESAVQYHADNKTRLSSEELVARTYEIRDDIKGDADCVGTELAKASSDQEIARVHEFAKKLSNCGNRGNRTENRFEVFGWFLDMSTNNLPKQPTKAPAQPGGQAAAKAATKRPSHGDDWAKGMFTTPTKKSPKYTKKK